MDSTDGVTPETGLTITNTDVDLSKDGAAFASKNSGGLTADGSNGWYSGTFDTTDTNTVGVFKVEVTVSGALPVWETYFVVEEAVYDALYDAGAAGYAVATDIVSSGAITTSGGAVSTVTTTTTNTDMRGTDSAFLASADGSTLTAIDLPNQTMDIVGDITGNLSGSVGSVTAGVTVTTNNDKTGYALSTAGILAIWDQVTSALTTAGRIGKLIVDMAGATFSTSTDSLEAIRNRGDAAWITGGGGSNPTVLQNTTIATLASQTGFTLTAGSADNDAYNDMIAVITDASTSTQKAVARISNYVGATKTITLEADPGIFTMAIGDTIDIIAQDPFVPPSVAEFEARTLVSGGYFDPAADTVANVTLTATTTAVTNDVGITQAAADKAWNTTSRTLTDGIQKNATFNNFMFEMVLTSDHVTPATGLTVTGQRSIDAGSYANVTGTITEISNGTYQIDLTAADTNGDIITYRFSGTAADDTKITITTQ